MKRTGFTLVEILIVVIILGILAAIVVPQFTDASNEARLSSLTSDLQTVRGQIELYKMQHAGRNPQADAVTQTSTFWDQLTTKTEEDGSAGDGSDDDLGPYLGIVPGNPFRSGNSDIVVDGADDDASGWSFTTATGLFSALGADGDGNDLTGY